MGQWHLHLPTPSGINPLLLEICRLLIFTGVVGVEAVFMGVPGVRAGGAGGRLLGKLRTLQMSRKRASLLGKPWEIVGKRQLNMVIFHSNLGKYMVNTWIIYLGIVSSGKLNIAVENNHS